MAKRQDERARGAVIWKSDVKALVRVTLGTDPGTGKRITVSETVTGSTPALARREAQTTLTRLLSKKDDGQLFVASRDALAEYLDTFLEIVQPDIKASSHLAYAQCIRLYLKPRLGNVKLQALTGTHIRQMRARMLDEKKDDGRQRFSRSTVALVMRTLRTALNVARREKLIQVNPMDDMQLPKQTREKRVVDKDKVPALHTAEYQKFMAYAQYEPEFAMWVTGITAGLRPQELFALHWSDLVGSKLTVQRALVRQRDGSFGEGMQKTYDSYRVIPLPEETVAALVAWRKKQAALKLEKGEAYDRSTDLIFATDTGKHLDHNNVSKRWRKLLKRAGLRHVKLYGIRHTMATILLENGVPVKVVSERLGHANVKTTLEWYAHVSPKAADEAADVFSSILRKQG